MLMRRAQAVRCTLVDLERRVLDDLGREQGRIGDWHDLIVVAMQDQSRHVKFLEILCEVRLGECFDAKVRGGKSGHHSRARASK